MSVNSKMTAIADEIRELSGTTDPMGLDAMASNVADANTDVETMAGLIEELEAALEGKSVEGGGAGVVQENVTLDFSYTAGSASYTPTLYYSHWQSGDLYMYCTFGNGMIEVAKDSIIVIVFQKTSSGGSIYADVTTKSGGIVNLIPHSGVSTESSNALTNRMYFISGDSTLSISCYLSNQGGGVS